MAYTKSLAITSTLLFIMWLGILGTSQATSRRFKENPNSTLFLEFERWMAAFDKHYPNDEEKERRFAIFKNKLEWVKNFNKQGNHSFTGWKSGVGSAYSGGGVGLMVLSGGKVLWNYAAVRSGGSGHPGGLGSEGVRGEAKRWVVFAG
ncbi:uncharacterized protein LOC112198460 [Rosa chinensis]|uniref:uncharacterized protein LOC112198460 n=1 Tax=Rosa chinensis TaxID=74649 RepID=UPI000D09436E|nr:uncharacterized protein LOC112198460 [Rosa chinensis]